MLGGRGRAAAVAGFMAILVASACAPSDESAPTVTVGPTLGSSTTTLPPTTTVPEWTAPEPTIPVDAVAIAPGESIQDAVDAGDEEDVFVLAAGVHRLQQVHPKSGQSFVGESGAVLNGARLLEDFVQDGDLWRHDGVAAEGEQRGTCASDRPTCVLPEDLFYDGERLTRVESVEQVDEDSWFLDYETDTLYLGRDPGSTEVELSILPYAFGGDAREVRIEGLIIEKYASPAQRGAIMAGRAWEMVGNEIRWNHGAGLYVGSELLVADNYIHHNGQFGIEGGGFDSVYERNEIAYNHLGDFSFQWGAGGAKFVHTTRIELRDNYVHDNAGPGLWIDGYNEDTLFEGNRVLDNLDSGIKIEISGSARVIENEVRRNGFGNPDELRAAGIMVRESGPVEIEGNTVEGNVEAVILHHDESRDNDTGNRLHGIHVHDNRVVLDGMVGYFGDIPFDAFANADFLFENNTYVGGRGERAFLDHGEAYTFEEWQQRGRDDGSVLSQS